MKPLPDKRPDAAFTVLEFLVVIAIIAVLILALTPVNPGHDYRHVRSGCVNQLKQNGMALILWTTDHEDHFPWQVSTTDGGTRELVERGRTFPHFQVLSNIHPRPETWVCPTDPVKSAATNCCELSDQNVSYFVSLVSPGKGSVTVLSGDRHLQANGQPVKPGLFLWTTNLAMAWTRELHYRKGGRPMGNLLFADGHVEVEQSNLSKQFGLQNLFSARLLVP